MELCLRTWLVLKLDIGNWGFDQFRVLAVSGGVSGGSDGLGGSSGGGGGQGGGSSGGGGSGGHRKLVIPFMVFESSCEVPCVD
ncbi:hypothetical protein OIU74_030012 [Salix koriyanagi]|uniref:Uncharacterized protein n=1 Tax=Salix koriyanagi TaxID=2511006 RepID=A0A9Q0VF54_9ROSI|nr:hypothetical protein OIU74_030012 [Salix koriyanagi]